MPLGPIDIALQVSEARAQQRDQARRDAETLTLIREALARSRSGTQLAVTLATLAEVESLVNR